MNTRSEDSLPLDVRGTLEHALNDATRYVESITVREEADAIEAIRASGKSRVIELTAEERSALKEALRPVHQQMEGRIGREVLESIDSATRSD